jgi:hypothetical protein
MGFLMDLAVLFGSGDESEEWIFSIVVILDETTLRGEASAKLMKRGTVEEGKV